MKIAAFEVFTNDLERCARIRSFAHVRAVMQTRFDYDPVRCSPPLSRPDTADRAIAAATRDPS